MTPEERSLLEEKFLLALLTRDAKVWREAMTRSHLQLHDNTGAPKPKKAPATFLSEVACSKCGSHRRYVRGEVCVKCADEKTKRLDVIRADALAKIAVQTIPRGLGGLRPSQFVRVPTLAPPLRAAPAPAPAPARPKPKTAVKPNSARAAAVAAGAPRYRRETPCKKCGGVEFFVRSYSCAGCHNAANQEAKRRARAAKSPAPTMAEPRRPRASQIARPVLAGQRPTEILRDYRKRQRWAAN